MALKLNRNGRIVFNPLMGPYNSYPQGSQEWHVAFSRSVQSEFDRMQFAHPKDFAMLLVKAVNTDYRPWEHWPKEAKKSPDRYFRMVIGCSWDEARRLVIGQGGEEGMQWVRVIDGALQEWEAENTPKGRPALNVSVTDNKAHATRESAAGFVAVFKSEQLLVTIKPRRLSPNLPLASFPLTQQQSQRA